MPRTLSQITVGRLAAALLTLVVLVSCSDDEDSPSGSDSATTTSADDASDSTTSVAASGSLETLATDFVGDTNGGVDVLLERDGVRERVAAGIASDDGQELEPGRVFRAGSISKPFTAVMVMQLVDEGIVDLDRPLGDYLPDTVIGADHTIRQLLSHQSGIPNYTDQPTFFRDVLADRSRRFTPAEIVDTVVDVPSGPRDVFAYSNTNYILLGQLVEALDGTDLNRSLQTRVAGPAGLERTSFDTGEGPAPDDLVGGWSSTGDEGDPTAPYQSIASSAWAAGSLLSTAEDLAAFLGALAGGELVSSESLTEMTATGSTGYGLGLFQAGFSRDQTGYGHNGSIPGYSSTMAIDPASGETLVILTNNDALNADQLAARVLTSAGD